MRTVPSALLLLSLVLAPTVVRAQEEVVRLKVGETKAGFGTLGPICDAPSVAVLWDGVLRGVGVGETLCSAYSIQAQGTRRIYRVIVTAADAPRDDAKADDSRGSGRVR
jgi:hypothetical protein